MTDVGALHAHTRTNLVALLRDLGPEEVADTPVPACPAWTVKHTVSHLTGVAGDILAGNLQGVTTDPWTAAQVDARRHLTLTEILAEWDETDPQVEPMSSAFGEAEVQWLLDCMTHDFDIRGALAAPVERASDALDLAVDWIVPRYQLSSATAGLPVATVRTGDRTWEVDDPAGSVTAPAFELLRGLTGRRSPEQVAAWTWDTDPTPFLPALTYGPFTPRPDPLHE